MTLPLREMFVVAMGWLIVASPSPAAESIRDTRAPIIVFMTDYGTLDDAVAICKGVMLSIAPESRIIDLTHQVKAYSILDGARYLARSALYYPANTIFIGVVDPGVGTKRRPIIAKSKRGQYFVVPDNGLLKAPVRSRTPRGCCPPRILRPFMVATSLLRRRDTLRAAKIGRASDRRCRAPCVSRSQPRLSMRAALPAMSSLSMASLAT